MAKDAETPVGDSTTPGSGSDEIKGHMDETAAPIMEDAVKAVKAVKAGNAKDVDIAAQILAEYATTMGPEGWTKEEEKKLMRKVDLRLIPIVRFFPPPLNSARTKYDKCREKCRVKTY